MASEGNSAVHNRHPWDVWAESAGLSFIDSSEDERDCQKDESDTMKLDQEGTQSELDCLKDESDTMKLDKADMHLYGFYPSWDGFVLAVCEKCKSKVQVVKLQCLKKHMEIHDKSDLSFPLNSSHNESIPTESARHTKHHSKSTSNNSSPNSSFQNSSNSSSKSEKSKGSSVESKKNNALVPVVKVECISSAEKMEHSPQNYVHSIKNEPPSPEQPPPSEVLLHTLSPANGSPSLLLSQNSNSSLVHSSSRSGISSPQQRKKKQQSADKVKVSASNRTLCEDSTFDPNNHCGVINLKPGKPCPKSLAYKDHSRSQQRLVEGRKKSPAAEQNSRIVSPVIQRISSASTSVLSSSLNLDKVNSGPSNSRTAIMQLKHKPASSPPFQTVLPQWVPYEAKVPEVSQSSLTVVKTETDKKGASDHADQTDPPYVAHHPKPFALCSFGFQQLPNKTIICDQTNDFECIQKSFKDVSSAEPLSSSQTLKKLCMESPLPLPSGPLDLSDHHHSRSFWNSEAVYITTAAPQTTITFGTSVAKSEKCSLSYPIATSALSTSKTKLTAAPVATAASSRLSSQKTVTKSREKNSSSKSSAAAANKKLRMSPSVPNGSSISAALTSYSLTASNVIPVHSVPFSAFNFASGEVHGALPSLQMMNQDIASSASIANSGPVPFTSMPVMTKNQSSDAWNGQPLMSNLHSVTVNGPVFPPSCRLDLTMGSLGFMPQFAAASEKSSCVGNPAPSNAHLPSPSHLTLDTQRIMQANALEKNSKTTNIVNSEIPYAQQQSSLTNILRMSMQNSLSPNAAHSSHLSENFLHSDAGSPHMPVSFPIHNGVAYSPPPPPPTAAASYYSPKSKSISGTIENQAVCLAMVQGKDETNQDFSPHIAEVGSPKGSDCISTVSKGLPQYTGSNPAAALQLSLPLVVTKVEHEAISPASSADADNEPAAVHSLLGTSAINDAQQPKSRKPSRGDTVSGGATSAHPLQLPLLVPSLTSVHQLLQQMPADILKKNGISGISSSYSLH